MSLLVDPEAQINEQLFLLARELDAVSEVVERVRSLDAAPELLARYKSIHQEIQRLRQLPAMTPQDQGELDRIVGSLRFLHEFRLHDGEDYEEADTRQAD